MNLDSEGPRVGNDLLADNPRGAEWLNVSVRSTMETLRDQVDDQGLRDVLDDVAHGKRPLRDLLSQAGFSALVSSGVDEYRKAWRAMTTEQRRVFVQEVTQAGAGLGLIASSEEARVIDE
ncbi:MAG: hypothetical protein FWF36_09670 [Propionibacteriaceae bacterium]|nr:hypothetical protein [Propionibacteriaceae bacterium]